MSADKSGCFYIHTLVRGANIVPPTWRHAQQDKQMTSKCATKRKAKKNWICKKCTKVVNCAWRQFYSGFSHILTACFLASRFLKWKICVDVSQLAPARGMQHCTSTQHIFVVNFFSLLRSLFHCCIVSVEDWMFNIFENFIFVVKLTLFGMTFSAQPHTHSQLSQQRVCCFHICSAISRFYLAWQRWKRCAVRAHIASFCFCFSLSLHQNAVADRSWQSCPPLACSSWHHHRPYDQLFGPSSLLAINRSVFVVAACHRGFLACLSVCLSACLVHFSRLVFDKVHLELMQMTACHSDTYTNECPKQFNNGLSSSERKHNIEGVQEMLCLCQESWCFSFALHWVGEF